MCSIVLVQLVVEVEMNWVGINWILPRSNIISSQRIGFLRCRTKVSVLKLLPFGAARECQLCGHSDVTTSGMSKKPLSWLLGYSQLSNLTEPMHFRPSMLFFCFSLVLCKFVFQAVLVRSLKQRERKKENGSEVSSWIGCFGVSCWCKYWF